MMYRLSIALGVLLLIACGAGCSNSPGDAERPKPALPPLADPAAAAFLIEAQQALQRADFNAALALADSAERHAAAAGKSFLADVSFLRARIHAELNHDEQVRAAYMQTLSLQPDYRGAWLNLGNYNFRHGRYGEALACYRHEQERYPDPKTLVYMGRAYAGLGHADSARYAYEQALQVDDALAEAHARLGQLYDSDGETEKALSHARRALTLEESDAGYRYLVGLLLLRSGKAEEAFHHLSRVAAQRPRDHEVHYNLGQALIRLGHTAQARSHLATADSLRALDAKLSEWKTLTRLHPDDPAVWATYGFALARSERDAEALRAYKAALHLDPANIEVRFELANLYMKHGEPQEAVGHYEIIVQQDSTLVGAWLNAGIAYARAGQPQAARKAWQAVLHRSPNHPRARAYLARLSEGR